MSSPALIACHECDALQRETVLPVGGTARCVRCGAELYHNTRNCVERTLALTLAAALLFVVANFFPIMGLEVQGVSNATTLFGSVQKLYDQDRTAVAGLVLVTTIIAPATQLATLIYLLLPLRFNRVPRGFAVAFRFIEAIRPWGMIEVFMLGVLVSLVKLAHVASVTPGIALWSFGALMLLLAGGAASFDARDLWHRVETIQQGSRAASADSMQVAR
jgi:paraquat-inducible protein A